MPIVSFDKFSGGKPLNVAATTSPEQMRREIEDGEEFDLDDASLVDRVKQTIQRRGAEVQEKIAGEGDEAGKSSVRRGAEAAAEAAGAIPEVAYQALPAWARAGLKVVGEKVGQGFKALTDTIGSNPALQKWVQDNPEAAKAIEEVAGTTKAVGEVADVILGAKAAAKGAEAATKATVDTSRFLVDQTKRGTAGIYNRSKELINPSPAADDALRQVLQGKTKDAKAGAEAFSAVDDAGKPVVNTKGVKTYAKLNENIDDSIGRLSREVDDVLAQDPTVRPLTEYTRTITTKGGQTVSTNYVEKALAHLKEVYEKTDDVENLADLNALIEKANTTGLTRLEVNDLSRIYGIEFGQKAFGKTGDPLTSVNAQSYENVRTGLKDTARDGLGGTAAAKTDKVISSLYNTQRLVKANIEAVNKLQQRIQEFGLLGKVGHAVSKYADILTGGTIRGLVAGILPRGMGLKVLNALDLEKALERNLKIIQEAAEKGGKDALLKAVEQITDSSS